MKRKKKLSRTEIAIIGGYARAASLSAEELHATAVKAANARWSKSPLLFDNSVVFDGEAYLKQLEKDRESTKAQLKTLRGNLQMLSKSIRRLKHRMYGELTPVEQKGQASLFSEEDLQADKNIAAPLKSSYTRKRN